MTRRLSAAALVVSGLATAGVPFLVWFAVDTPRGTVTATGVGATSEIWSLVVFGGFIVLAGLATAAGRGGGALALAVAGAAAMCVGWALENALNVPVGLVLVERGGVSTRVADDLVAVHVQPTAYLAAAAAAIGGMAALLRRLEEVS